MSAYVIAFEENSDFTYDNIPFGIGKYKDNAFRVVSAFGKFAIDLYVASELGLFDSDFFRSAPMKEVFSQPSLNMFMELGKPFWIETRKNIQHFLAVDKSPINGNTAIIDKIFIPLHQMTMSLPFSIGDYTDFYSSKEHATNVGTMFRGKDNALQPNWQHIPVGYHGRSSSIFESGTAIHRPCGQIKSKDGNIIFSSTQKLDFELEMAFVVGTGNMPGKPISVQEADDHIFGVVLMNDWSARDIQAWEYVPLGPFLGKNFGTIISPWVITLEALKPFVCSGPSQVPTPLAYLQDDKPGSYDVQLSVYLQESTGTKEKICSSNLKYLYWNFRQQLAHHTVNGCNMRSGDLCGTGTISGPTSDSYGSMLEISWNGSQPLQLKSGSKRSFIEDGDSIIIEGKCNNGAGIKLGFGECISPVLKK